MPPLLSVGAGRLILLPWFLYEKQCSSKRCTKYLNVYSLHPQHVGIIGCTTCLYGPLNNHPNNNFRFSTQNSYLPFHKMPSIFLLCTSYFIAKYHNNVISAIRFSWSRSQGISRRRLVLKEVPKCVADPDSAFVKMINYRLTIVTIQVEGVSNLFQAVLQGRSLEIRYYLPRICVLVASFCFAQCFPVMGFSGF